MSKSKHGKIDGQFVPLLHATLDCPAWVATSHGARSLYVALKRRHPRERNTAYISYRTAQKELTASPSKIREWFAELEHYGFTVLHQPGCLGVDGKGKAPHWRLTELGNTSRASADGLLDPPTRDYLRWDGVMFDPLPFRDKRGSKRWREHQKQNPVTDGGNTPLRTGETPPLWTGETPPTESVTDGVHIQANKSVTDGVHISRLTTTVVPPNSTPPSSKLSSEGSLEGESGLAHLGESNVVEFDPRIAALEATERKRRLR
jgi:hypothetical protein